MTAHPTEARRRTTIDKQARTFREELQPIGGALYDERVFKVL